MLFVVTLTMKAWFRGLAAAMKSEASAQALAGFSILVLVLYTGYAIPKVRLVQPQNYIQAHMGRFAAIHDRCTTMDHLH